METKTFSWIEDGMSVTLFQAEKEWENNFPACVALLGIPGNPKATRRIQYLISRSLREYLFNG